MKIAAVTLVRDSEKYIIPHLKMYKGVDKNIALFVTQPIIGGSTGHGEPDSSEELIKKHCPEVEIHQTSMNRWGADLFNFAVSLAADCDKVIIFHADVVISPIMWKKLFTLLKETDFDVYRLDMKRCTINYYHNFEYGVRDCLDNEPIALKTSIKFSNFYDTPEGAKIHTIDNPEFEVHHFTGWKGVFTTQEWVEGKAVSESSISIDDLKPLTGWLPCPQEIRNLFNESSF